MYIPFSDIDFESRVWIYQANRKLTNEEAGIITETLKASLDNWDAHGKPLTASGKIFEHRFVVIAVDERDELPSGCSIDKSVHWLQEIGQRMNIDFFDRSLAYLDANNEVQTIPVPKIKQAVADEVIEPSTTIFDHQVATKAQWMTRWKIPASNSWLNRYFSQQTSL
jgi:phage host-nuclease inhibitor protein Gam